MAVTLQSVQSTGYTTSGTLTITKPLNLAVGDLMFAFIQGDNLAQTPPSGFTVIKDYTVGSGNSRMWTYYKIADSGDVSGSNFSWTNGGGRFAGIIARITGHNVALPASIFNFDDETSSTTPTFTSTVTPDNADSLIMFCVGTYQNSVTTRTASGYAVATSDPSWTERVDQTDNSSGSYTIQMSLATASRPQTTATGNASVTMNGICLDLGNIMVVIRPQIISTTSDTTSTTDTFKKQVGKRLLDTTSITDTLVTEKDRIWSNPDKTSTNWVNQDKS